MQQFLEQKFEKLSQENQGLSEQNKGLALQNMALFQAVEEGKEAAQQSQAEIKQ